MGRDPSPSLINKQLLEVSLPSLLSLWAHHYLQFKSSHHINATESLEVTWATGSNSFWEYQGCDRQGMRTQSTGVYPDAGEYLRTWGEANRAQTLRSLELVISRRHKHTLKALSQHTQHLATADHLLKSHPYHSPHHQTSQCSSTAWSQLCMHRYLSSND